MEKKLNEELLRQLLLMNFDRSKTLLEQKPDEVMPGQIETMGYVQGKPETLEPALKKQEQFFKDIFEKRHEILMVSSLALTIFGGPLGNVLSIGLDLGDAALYFAEGDPYMAGLSLLFTVLPAGQLAAKYTKSEIKSTINALRETNALIKKGKTPKKLLTKRQKEITKLITSTKVTTVAIVNLFKTTIKTIIKKLGLRGVVKLIFWLFKKGYLPAKFLIKNGLIIGGILYSWHKIAE
jgi:DNA-binding CsgD family transcriptional regulator